MASACGLSRLLDLDLDSSRLHLEEERRAGDASASSSGAATRPQDEALALVRSAAALQRLVVRSPLAACLFKTCTAEEGRNLVDIVGYYFVFNGMFSSFFCSYKVDLMSNIYTGKKSARYGRSSTLCFARVRECRLSMLVCGLAGEEVPAWIMNQERTAASSCTQRRRLRRPSCPHSLLHGCFGLGDLILSRPFRYTLMPVNLPSVHPREVTQCHPESCTPATHHLTSCASVLSWMHAPHKCS